MEAAPAGPPQAERDMPVTPRSSITIAAVAATIVATAAAALLVVGAPPTMAADAQSTYKLRGLGALSCARYLEDRRGDPKGSEAYAHWFTGYLTAYNYLQAQTFDIAPSHDAQALLTYLDLYCAENPNVLIGVAAQRFVSASSVYGNRQVSGP